MPSQFNSYIDNIDTDFWQNLCKSRGQLRHYDKGEAFIMAGKSGAIASLLNITPTHLSRLRKK